VEKQIEEELDAKAREAALQACDNLLFNTNVHALTCDLSPEVMPHPRIDAHIGDCEVSFVYDAFNKWWLAKNEEEAHEQPMAFLRTDEDFQVFIENVK